MKNQFKGPLKINFKGTTKNLVKGVITLGVFLPLTLGITKLVGGKNQMTKKKVSRKTNPWIVHVKKIKSQNKGKSLKDVLKIASKSYKKK